MIDRRLAALTLLTSLVGCSEDSFGGPHWDDTTGYALYEPGDVYVVVLTSGKPDDPGAFGDHADVVAEQLTTQEGLVLYAFGGSFWEGTAETLSVWRDYDALGAFLTSPAHADAMERFAGSIKDAHQIFWEIDGADLPPTWDDAHARLEEESP